MAGVVSNLQDASIIERSLRSLDGEKERRARIFESIDELSSKNISEFQKYQKKHPERTDLEPMPYLITVLDEFAEFKSQFPEQMDLFNSITRVGRSYGIYMVLSTQSPGGIITAQMESNIRFRICLRTANTGESKEIIGTTDAFFISNPGRAYIKVGDSIYEQVQTFYSKAPYNPNRDKKTAVTEIDLVELDGRRVRPEAHDKTVGGAADDVLSEGQMVVRSIVETARQNQLPKARPVWTEPLPPHPDKDNPKKLHYLYLSEVSFNRAFQDGAWQERNSGLAVTAGLVDNPEAQRQYPFVLDFMNEGHQILYGAPSAGKTTFLQTAILSAALSYTPEQLQFLVLDFGNWGMKIFEGLPHMLMVGDAGDKEKLKKAEEYLLATMDSRKRLFASQGVGTLTAYREVSGQAIPALIVAVDNMAALYSQYPDMMDSLIQIAREGGGLGVYLLLTAGNPGSFMFRIAQYVKSSHALQLTDRADYRPLVGGTGRQEPGHYPGRGFTAGPLEFQTALCVEAATEGERVKQLRELCGVMSAAWEGPRASMEAAPQSVNADALAFDRDSAEIGVSLEDKAAAPVAFAFADMNGCVISGPEGSGKSNALGLILRALGQDSGTTLYLYEQGTFLEGLCPGARMAHDGPSSDALLSELAEEYDRRSDEGGDYQDARIVLCIDDFPAFFEGVSEEALTGLDVIIRNGSEQGMYVYIAGDKDGLGRLHTFLVKPLESCLAQGNAIALEGSLKDHTIFSSLHHHEDVPLPGREGCLIHNGEAVLLRLAGLSPLVKKEVA
ncbi:MAG: hypothetical protein IJR68_03595 [Fretibacterium sp.]|nr:hypothetical protein [Fretibacterium sp.]